MLKHECHLINLCESNLRAHVHCCSAACKSFVDSSTSHRNTGLLFIDCKSAKCKLYPTSGLGHKMREMRRCRVDRRNYAIQQDSLVQISYKRLGRRVQCRVREREVSGSTAISMSMISRSSSRVPRPCIIRSLC